VSSARSVKLSVLSYLASISTFADSPLVFLIAASLFVPHILAGMPQEKTPSASSMNAADVSLEDAQRALMSKDFGRAREILETLLKKNPNSAQAQLLMAAVEVNTGHPDAAILHFKRSLAIQPKSFDAHYGVALALLHENKIEEGTRELRTAVRLNPKNPDAAYNLAVLLLDAGQPKEALHLLESVRAAGPDGPDLSYNIIRAQLLTRQFDEAVKTAQASAKFFGDDMAWQLAVGKLFLAAGNSTEAIQHLKLASNLRPGDPETLDALAAAYLAANQLNAVLALLPNPLNPEECYLSGSAFLALARMEEAHAASACSLKGKPDDPRFLLLSAKIAQRRGQQTEALRILQRAAELAPRWPDVFYSEGVSYYFLSRYPQVRTALDRALQLAPNSAGFLFLYAISYENERKLVEAAEYLHRAIKIEPANPRFQCHLGTVLLQQERFAEAQQSLDAAIGLKPDYALPHYELGKLYERQKKFQPAASELETALRYEPDLAQAMYQLSRVYAALGQQELAASTMDKFKAIKQRESREAQEMLDDVTKQLQAQQ
jgi:tetratricopeptide (TPR) repeat protein